MQGNGMAMEAKERTKLCCYECGKELITGIDMCGNCGENLCEDCIDEHISAHEEEDD